MIGRASLFVRAGVLAAALGIASVVAAKPAAPRVFWSGTSGGVRWTWTDGDITAAPGTVRVPRLSLKRHLFPDGFPDGYKFFSCTARPLSLFGPLLCYRRDDYWEGGAHPSGWISYGVVDARHPDHPPLVTEVFGEKNVRDALWNDPIIHKLAVQSSLKTEPATALELVKKLSGKTFGGEIDSKYAIPEGLLTEWSVHHLEGDKASVRLCVAWGTEIYRFQSTEIGLLLPVPASYREALAAASAGREGFLAREAGRRFRKFQTTLIEGKSPNP
jgi:hypothetical protein